MAGKMIACFKRNKEESWAMRNGRMLLEESISLFDGKVNPIRFFSARELKTATNNFNLERNGLYRGSCGDYSLLYRGFLRGQEVIVKKNSSRWRDLDKLTWTIRDIVVASRLSVHRNVLKLIGCCLDVEIPMLVYESFDCDGTLEDQLHDYAGIAWKHRLKIAVDLSNLVAYLHTALPRPLIHRDLKLSKLLMDKENGVVKLFYFELCMSLPKGKSFLEPDHGIAGTYGYIDPEYLSSSRFNEKADVYAFGVILVVLLSGQRPYSSNQAAHTGKQACSSLVARARDCVEKNDRFEEILDPKLSVDKSWLERDGHLRAFLMLALECTRDRGVDRPDITQAGRSLARMYRSPISHS